MKFFVLLILLVAPFARGATPEPCVEKRTLSENETFKLGLATAWVVPNQMPLFKEALIVYGPAFSVPLGPHALQFQFHYGSSRDDWALFSESAIRFHLPTPFLRPFVTTGVNHLYYHAPTDSLSQFGGHVGLGLLVSGGNALDLQFSVKYYFLKQSLFAVGGSFMFHL